VIPQVRWVPILLAFADLWRASFELAWELYLLGPYLFLRGLFERISFSSILYTVASPFGMVKPGRGWSAVGIWLGRSVVLGRDLFGSLHKQQQH
jgi:hypothetical protein